jgi:hypothetical protein
MLAQNRTPFAALGFEQKHRDGADMAVLAVRGVFRLGPDGRLALASDQQLVLADEYEGDPHATPLLRVGDLIPFKPATDVTVLAEARAPGDEPRAGWEVGVRFGRVDHRLRVSGPRAWTAGASGFSLGEAQAALRVPVDYRFAAGGPILGDPDHDVDHKNPIGAGVIDARHTARDRSYPAPAVDSEAEPVGDAFARPEPQGLGPVPPWWMWRRRWTGTYDDAWLATRHPQLPADFDYRFYQTAHPALVLPGYARGDEEVALTGLTPGGALGFTLPGVAPWALFQWVDGSRASVRLHLDGVHLDVRDDPPWRLDLTWRAWVKMHVRVYRIELFQGTTERTSILPATDEQGAAVMKEEARA